MKQFGLSPTLFAAATEGDAGGGGMGQPGDPTKTPGTGEGFDPKKYVSVEDFGKTAAMIRGLQNTLKTLTDGMLTAEKLAELGLLEKTDDGFKPKTLAVAGETKPNTDGAQVPAEVREQLKRLEGEQAKLTRKLAEKEQELVKRDADAAKQRRVNALVASLREAGAVKPERDYVHLIDQVIEQSGSFMVKARNKFGEEATEALDEFVPKWLESQPELRKAEARGGSGTPSGQPAAGANGRIVATVQQYSDPQWAKDHMKDILSGKIDFAPAQF